MPSFSRELIIEWGDCDPAGIVFYPRYFAMFNASTDLMVSSLGVDLHALLEKHLAVGWPMVDSRAVFKLPCSFGDQVRIQTTVTEVHESKFEIIHELYKADGRLAVTGFDKRVWAVRHPERAGELKSAPIPEELRRKLIS
ncbi:acyl-CoA thioesterase [Stutzerimonas frequens]|uniref:acyl-CoA thioesterase n=1 Tax=Stutzerimonas frequens TaxID=2968969 RepID=UPI0013A676DC|nr:acyl-CoA thioesterase [Stutzerimonas frequens]